MKGKFIVIEGLEGAGKSTAITLCQTFFNEQGISLNLVREPGGTPLAESLRRLVKQAEQEEVTPETELLLMYAARSQLLHHVIRPKLTAGQWVLADRHDWSSQAYQGGGRGLSQETIGHLSDCVLSGLTPDLILYLDIDPKIGLARARGRGALDRIEQEDLAFFQRTRARYLELAASEANCVSIDASQAMADVHREILAVLSDFYQRVN